MATPTEILCSSISQFKVLIVRHAVFLTPSNSDFLLLFFGFADFFTRNFGFINEFQSQVDLADL
jgi:hypothetical protein